MEVDGGTVWFIVIDEEVNKFVMKISLCLSFSCYD